MCKSNIEKSKLWIDVGEIIINFIDSNVVGFIKD